MLFRSIDHNDLRHKLLKEIENVRWVPAQGLERMRGMLLVRPDWCLSRKRLWGIPIPAVKCRSCNEVILAKEVIEKSAEVFKRNPIARPTATFILPLWKRSSCSAKTL